jgi:4-hydroxy-4-methyl-2-oxoglutarate aldolase
MSVTLEATADLLARLGTATLAEVLDGGVVEPAPQPLWAPVAVAGPAFTIDAPSGDNLPFHLAVAEAPPGAVLTAVTGKGTSAVWGGILSEAAQARHIAGLVTDGLVRDTGHVRRRGFPVFCAGTTPRGSAKTRAGALQTPVALGGVTVRPDDWILADEDGVIVIAREALERALGRARSRVEHEDVVLRRLADGEVTLDIYGLRALATEGGGTE